jgi:PAS domain S-box-containing protein
MSSLVELSGVGAWSLARDGKTLIWDSKAREIYGAPADLAPTLDTALAFHGPEARAVLSDAIEGALSRGRPFDVELPLADATGAERWVRMVGRPVVDVDSVVRLDGVLQDVTERHGREAAIARLQARFEAIVNNTPVAISLRDRFGTIHLANGRYEAIAGRRNLSGLFEADLFPEPVAEQLVAHDQEAIAIDRPVVAEDTYIHPDGSSTTLLTARFMIEDAVLGDRVICAIGADITEQKALQARLEQARADAEAATRAKADLLSTISHELRTPMNGVVGMAEALVQTQLSDAQRTMVTVIRDSGKLLVALVNDLLDFAKVERGAITLETIPFRPEDIVATVVPVHSSKAAAKGVAIEVAVADAARATRLGDPLRLQQIMHNLVGNAIKFTEAGHVRIGIDGDALGRLTFSVSDTGIGMTADQATRVFDSFTQADPSIARRFGGTGLGLSIVKGLVTAMGGEVRLDTMAGVGSTFTVTLPLQQAAAKDEEMVGRDTRADALSGRRILVADDNEINRMVLTAFLDKLGVDVLAVDGGRAAVASAQENRFDAILLDVVMPDLDGPEALARIRADEAAAGRLSPPAVAVTGRASAEEIEACLNAGFAAHIAKPIDEAKLRAVLVGVITGRRIAR